MIPHAEILALRGEWLLRDDVIEKDYVLGWILAGIGARPELADHWVFKGGTCLRKCYYETYRFSEDLDFTVIKDGPEEPEELVEIFAEIGDWLFEQSGIEIVVDDDSFVRRRNRRGNTTTMGRIAYRGPRNAPTLPKLKLDLTSDEVLVQSVVRRPILHPYTDASDIVGRITAYSISELLAEKTRALTERCRPRDLYDVINLHRHPELLGDPDRVLAGLKEKCRFAGVGVPDAASIRESPFRDELDQEWENMLGHQLPHLPPIEDYWTALDEFFEWLAGAPRTALPRAELGGRLDPHWTAPRSMVAWRSRSPMELIRFAGSNRLLIEIDYHGREGRSGPRVVEPYSLRTTLEGHLLLYVVNDSGQLRSYRVDRIVGVRVLDRSFTPRYAVEF